jgi:threonine dehydrogenase-like Zn-dependent dehydrogenase
MDLTNGEGSHVVIEAVGHMPAYEQSYGVVRPGGVISRVGVPQYENAPVGFASLFGKNITLTGGVAPVRAYLEEAIPRARRHDRARPRVRSHHAARRRPAAYAAMDSREAH